MPPGRSRRPVVNRSMLLMVCGLTLLVTMGISSLLPSLPLLAAHFGVPPEESWKIISAFALPGLVFVPLVGMWADRYGRKHVLVPALFVFAVGGICCMFARSFAELLVFRALQGAGSAPLGLLYTTIIADTWQGELRLKAMSYSAVSLGLGTAAGPALGGALAMLDWRLPFLLPLLALPVAALALRLPLMRPKTRTPLRTYISETLNCARQKQTMVLLGLTLLTFIMLSGPIITCFPLLASAKFQASTLESGLIIAVSSLASGLSASILPRLYRFLSSRALFMTSCLLYTLALCAIPLTSSLWWLPASITIYGFAQGLNIPVVSTLLTGQVPEERRASIMAANAVLLRLGQNIGPALFGALAGFAGAAGAIAAGTTLALGMAALVVMNPLPSLRRSEEQAIQTFEP